jgi:hypothetical protein
MMTASRRLARTVEQKTTAPKDTHITHDEAPVRPGINAQTPSTMPRGEDDDATRAHSPEFHDRPGSGKHTADRMKVF